MIAASPSTFASLVGFQMNLPPFEDHKVLGKNSLPSFGPIFPSLYFDQNEKEINALSGFESENSEFFACLFHFLKTRMAQETIK